MVGKTAACINYNLQLFIIFNIVYQYHILWSCIFDIFKIKILCFKYFCHKYQKLSVLIWFKNTHLTRSTFRCEMIILSTYASFCHFLFVSLVTIPQCYTYYPKSTESKYVFESCITLPVKVSIMHILGCMYSSQGKSHLNKIPE